MSKNYLTTIFVFLSVLITSQSFAPSAHAEYPTKTLSGTVVKNVHDCRKDGTCFLEVQQLDGTVMKIYYGWEWLGDGIICQADKKLSDLAWSLKPGQVLEARGQLAKGRKTIYLCTQQNHYLNVNTVK